MTIRVEVCSETGVCSLIRPDNTKADLLPGEVAAIATFAEQPEAVRAVIGAADDAFAARLTTAELEQIARELR